MFRLIVIKGIFSNPTAFVPQPTKAEVHDRPNAALEGPLFHAPNDA